MSTVQAAPATTGNDVRQAEGEADIELVEGLDEAVFPDGNDDDRQAAVAGELRDAVKNGDVYLSPAAAPKAFMHIDRQIDGQICLAALGVHPDHQHQGLGTDLMADFLGLVESQRDTTPIWLVTSPNNEVMLTLVLNRGFSGRWLLRDYFGPGRHRICCQMRSDAGATPGTPEFVRRTDTEGLERRLDEGYMITALTDQQGTPGFELTPSAADTFLRLDRPRPKEPRD